MGIYDFMKGVGKTLGLGDDDDDAAKEAALKKELHSHNLGTGKVGLAVKGETVVLSGVVADQSAFEKAVVAIGNTTGVSKVVTDDLKIVPPDSGLKLDATDMTALVKASTPAREPVFHAVRKGDNLWKIAETVYGKGKGAKHTLIFEANRPMLSHPDKIYPGQVLRIPELV
ncbi:MAG: peptidoglycan-binding protein LysM [Rhizobiaceae bacterium]